MIYDLVQDFSAVLDAIPAEHSRRWILELLEEAIRRDVHFIDRHPTPLFQCLWNTCWWYDCEVAEQHYDSMEDSWRTDGDLGAHNELRMSVLMEQWLRSKESAIPHFSWLRSLRAPILRLGIGQLMMVTGHTGSVTSVAYSPDGQLIATASRDKTQGFGMRVPEWRFCA